LKIWAKGLVEHMSPEMCQAVLLEVLRKAGFKPPEVHIFDHTPAGYYEHNRYYNYVEGFLSSLEMKRW